MYSMLYMLKVIDVSYSKDRVQMTRRVPTDISGIDYHKYEIHHLLLMTMNPLILTVIWEGVLRVFVKQMFQTTRPCV